MSYEQKLRQRRSAPVLRFGSLIHLALAGYYVKGRRRGPHPAGLFIKAYEAEVEELGEFVMRGVDSETQEAKWEDAKELGVEMMEAYVEHYGGDSDWEVLGTEQPFKYPVRHPQTGRVLFYYAGIIDLIMRQVSTGRIWVWDHKTTDSIARWLRTLPLNEQAGSYWAFGVPWIKDQGMINPKILDDLSGMYFNFIRRARRDERPTNSLGQYLNKDGTVSKVQPPDQFHREPTYRTDYDRDMVRKRALNDFREMEMVRKGRLANKKSPSIFNCPNCGWTDVCELHETGADWKLMLDATTELWEPYAEHEIREAELR